MTQSPDLALPTGNPSGPTADRNCAPGDPSRMGWTTIDTLSPACKVCGRQPLRYSSVGCGHLDAPFLDHAVFAHQQLDPAMRIGPLEELHRALQRDGFLCIKHRAGVVGTYWRGRHQDNGGQQQSPCSNFHKYLRIPTAGGHYSRRHGCCGAIRIALTWRDRELLNEGDRADLDALAGWCVIGCSGNIDGGVPCPPRMAGIRVVQLSEGVEFDWLHPRDVVPAMVGVVAQVIAIKRRPVRIVGAPRIPLSCRSPGCTVAASHNARGVLCTVLIGRHRFISTTRLLSPVKDACAPENGSRDILDGAPAIIHVGAIGG